MGFAVSANDPDPIRLGATAGGVPKRLRDLHRRRLGRHALEIGLLDYMLGADLARPEPAFTDPTPHGLGLASNALGGLRNREHHGAYYTMISPTGLEVATPSSWPRRTASSDRVATPARRIRRSRRTICARNRATIAAMPDDPILERLDGHLARSNEHMALGNEHMARGNELMADIRQLNARGNELMVEMRQLHVDTRQFMRDLTRRNEIMMGGFAREMLEMREETVASRRVLEDLHEESVAQRQAILTMLDELRENGLGGRG